MLSANDKTAPARDFAARLAKNPVLCIAEHIAGRGGPTSRGDLIKELQLSHDPSTVYRWLNAAVSMGYLNNAGEKRGSLYTATESLRNSVMLRQVRAKLSSRTRVGYDRDFLREYDPVKNPLLKRVVRDQLSLRSPQGSLHLTDLSEGETSTLINEISFGSSRLGGNPLDLNAANAFLEHDIVDTTLASGYKVQLLNHRDACRHLVEGVKARQPEFGQVTKTAVRGLHAMLSKDLLNKRGGNAMCGTLRTAPILIKDSTYVPTHTGAELASGFDQVVATANRIHDPYEQSFFLLVHLPYLQPFVDCNRRTSRMLSNLPLVRKGIAPLFWSETDHVAYSEALLCIYEHQDTTAMTEVFFDAFMRASERILMLQRQREPAPVSVKYRSMIRETVRARVLHDEDRLPPSIAIEDAGDYLDYVEHQLREMVTNTMLGIQYGLSTENVRMWTNRTQTPQDQARHASAPDTDENSSMASLQQRERG